MKGVAGLLIGDGVGVRNVEDGVFIEEEGALGVLCVLAVAGFFLVVFFFLAGVTKESRDVDCIDFIIHLC